ncbi:hypothetical protein [Cucumibacter marinus]|uniref:hypothetical protein n=1 Tax=Cucumibacter marinus TaxID=1121252 RepID=UPI00041BEE38|nr:hypothetical protein [Cucumibacter marinus]
MAAERDTREFTFKPAMAAAAIRFVLADHALTCYRPGGQVNWTLDLRGVTRAALVDQTVRGVRYRRLDLIAKGQKHHIGINSTADILPGGEAETTHLALLEAVGEDLADINPDLPVTIGEHGGAKIAIFVIGALSLAGSLALFFFGVMRHGDFNAEAALPTLMLALFGVVLTLGYAPWRSNPSLPVKLLPEVIRALGGKGDATRESPGSG